MPSIPGWLDPEGPRKRDSLRATTGTRLPVVLVVISLASALVVPRAAQRRVNRLRDDINLHAEPARTEVAAIRVDLALEDAARRGYALTGDPPLARELAGSRQRRRVAQEQLVASAPHLDGAVSAELSTLLLRLSAVDADLDSLKRLGAVGPQPLAALRYRQRIFDDAMSATERLDSAIVRDADVRRTAIAETEQAVLLLTAFLVLLGLGAALLVARLGRRFRTVALRLEESDARFRQIAGNLNAVVWLSDPDFRELLYVNEAFSRLWCRSPVQLYADPAVFMDGVHPEDRTKLRAALALVPERASDVEFRVVRPDGETRWVWGRGFPVRDETGRVFRMAGIIEDITERRAYLIERERLLENEQHAREAAEQRRQELERVSESRARLVRGFTHDVKNPLGAADGFLSLLEEGVNGTLPDASLRWIGKARRSIGHALELIRSLLDLARAESGELDIRKSETDIAGLVREMVEAVGPQAAQKSIELRLAVAPELPAATTDPMRVRQVIGNLISNAVKYTPRGGHVVISASLDGVGSEPPRPRLAITVRDDGPGIPEHLQPLLFTEFTRFDPGAAEGAGIGLAISRKIATALGGEITVDSEVARGSAFTLYLPLDESMAIHHDRVKEVP